MNLIFIRKLRLYQLHLQDSHLLILSNQNQKI
nr:MAG TPA: hypothetical protein [Bacteriophage sp.]